MDTALGSIYDFSRSFQRLGVPLMVLALAMMVVAFVTALVVMGSLQPGPETVVVAPFRWFSSR